MAALPSGVTLQQIDGGANYYADNGFTNAVNAGWDNGFVPIGPWLDMMITQSDANRWHDLGWNTAYAFTANSDMSLFQSNGISAIVNSQELSQILSNNGGSFGPETVGLLSMDEPPTFADGVTTPLSTTANSIQDHKFLWLNTTWNFLYYQGLDPITSSAQVLDTLVTTPNGTQRHIDEQSVDIYWFAGAHASFWQGVGSILYNLGQDMTPDQMARGSNYGDMIDIERSFQTAYPAPITAFIEDGGPYTEDTSGSDYITPPELNWAVWSSLIHGARNIVYFNHTFAGPGGSQDNLSDPYYQTVQPGQTISIYNQVKATDALVEQMAPVLDSPFAMNYVTVAGPHYSYGTPDHTLGGLEVMAKDYNGQFYIFADTRDAETLTNIPATFTLTDPNAVSVTVVNENRTIAVVNGVFSDSFATAATVHIYKVNDSGTPPPPPSPPPSPPVISAFSPNTSGVDTTSTINLTGTAEASSKVTVFDGSTNLGTRTVDTSGHWSFTENNAANGTHVFTATDTDANGTSPASSAFNVTVNVAASPPPPTGTFSTTFPTAENPVSAGGGLITSTSPGVNWSGLKLGGGGNLPVAPVDVVASGDAQSVDYANSNFGDALAVATGTWTPDQSASVVVGNIAAQSGGDQEFEIHLRTDPTTGAGYEVSWAYNSDYILVATWHPNGGYTNLFFAQGAQYAVHPGDTLTASIRGNVITLYDNGVQEAQITDNTFTSGNPGFGFNQGGTHAYGISSFSASDLGGTSPPPPPPPQSSPPAAPVISSFSPNTGGVDTTSTITLKGTAVASSTVTVYDGTTNLGTTAVGTSGNWSFPENNAANGVHTFTATDTNANGTSAASAPFPVTVNDPSPQSSPPAAPVISSFSPNTGGVDTTSTITLKGTAVAGSTVTVYDGTTNLGTTAVDTSGNWSFPEQNATNGVHTFTATDTNANGTSAASAPFPVTVNVSSPTTNLVINGSFETGNFTGWTLSGNVGTSVWGPQVFINSNAESGKDAAVLGPVGSDGSLSQNIPTTAGGSYTLTFWLANNGGGPDDFTAKWNGQTLLALNNAPQQGYTEYTYQVTGGSGSTSNLEFDFRQDPADWSLDNISVVDPPQSSPPAAPVISSFSPNTGGVDTTSTITLKGTAVAGSTVRVLDGVTDLGTVTVDTSRNWSFTENNATNGTHTFTATDITSAGTSVASAPFPVTVNVSSPTTNLVINGSFETGDFTGWTLSGNVGTSVWGPQVFINSNAESGKYAAVLGPVGSDGTLSQNIQTTAGESYTVTFWLANRSGGSDDFSAKWNGQTLLALNNAPQQGYTEYTYQVTGGSGSTSNLEFDFRQDPTDWSLDNISVVDNGATSGGGSPRPQSSPPAAPVISSFSPNTGGVDTTSTITLKGTAVAGSTVTAYDGTANLGTTAVDTSGNWSLTENNAANGVHTFTATDTDATGTSAASSPFAVTVNVPSSSHHHHHSTSVISTASGTTATGSAPSITMSAGTITQPNPAPSPGDLGTTTTGSAPSITMSAGTVTQSNPAPSPGDLFTTMAALLGQYMTASNGQGGASINGPLVAAHYSPEFATVATPVHLHN